jgi:PKD repeat protein
VGTPPTAAFTPSATDVRVGEDVIFTNASTGTEPLTYEWDFGDGTTSTLENPTHAYAVPGVYTVKLTVTNVYGMDTAEAVITVRPDLSIDVYTDKATYAAGDAMQVGLNLMNPGPAEDVKLLLGLWTPFGYYPIVKTPINLPADFDFSNPDLFTWTVPDLPVGTYAWLGMLIPEGGGDTVSDSAVWTLTGGAPTASGMPEEALKELKGLDLNLGN